MRYVIYHNPKCSKSRQALQMLMDQKVNFEVIEYLKDPLSEKQILDLLSIIDVEPFAMVRTKETIFQTEKPPIETLDEIARTIAKFPTLLERPIVSDGRRAILGRPPENLKKLFT